MKNRFFLLSVFFLLLSFASFGQKAFEFTFQNPSLSVDERVKDLLSRLTLDEKVQQMIDVAPGIPRLGIPAYNWWNEALHGVARAGIATVFPQAIGLGATWDTSLIFRVADIISTEARAKHNEALSKNDFGRYKGLTIWSPNINIFRDPRWGRGQETYGEDPYLTSRIGVAFVKGLQGDDPKYIKTVSTPKHYAVHSGPEPERHKFNAITDKRDFYETYSPTFKALITEGGAWSIMGAYNRYMNDPACASPFLLQQTLRDQWKFKGYVVSDCDAIADIWRDHKFVKTDAEAAAISIKAGCDLNCGDTYLALVKAVKQGLVTENDIDRNLSRLFEVRFRLGMFDPVEMVKYAQIPFSANDTRDNRAVSYKSALESMVLLKNENNTLPLKKDVRTIAVIGPNANNAFTMYGNYNGTPSKAVTPLDGIRNVVQPGTNVLFAQGCGWAEPANSLTVVPSEVLSTNGKQGLQAEYFSNINLEGEPVLKKMDRKIDFNWDDRPPLGLKSNYNFSVRWTGQITVPESGTYTFAVSGDDGYRLYIDNKLVVASWEVQSETTKKVALKLNGGQSYDIKLEYFQNQGNASIRLEYSRESTVDPMAEALDVASKADVVVFFAGLSSSLEGEEMRVDYDGFKGGDRTSIDLPAIQKNLIRKIKATGKPVVVVLLNGSPLAVNWEDENIPAILEAWYPGEEGGSAIADVLFGNYNPAGRLPVTFYKSVDQLPPFEDYAMKGRTYRYFTGDPLYPFGYGLSYTRFAYSGLKLAKSALTGQHVTVSVDVANTGNWEGDEVVQLYVSNKTASVPVPIRSLEGFERIRLKPGEKKTVTFMLKPSQLSIINDNTKRIEQAGTFEISVGGGQPVKNQRLTSGFVDGTLSITGDPVELEL